MATDISLQALSFAAICQTVAQLQALGRFGSWTEQEVTPLLRALTVSDPKTAYDVFPENDLKPGFSHLIKTFGNEESREERNMEIAKYVFEAISLERKLNRNPDVMKRIFDRLDTAIAYADEHLLSVTDDEYVEMLADIYKQEVSDAKIYSFLVYGNSTYLQQRMVQIRIRALLLSAIRAVVLWRQLGGRRRTFIFRRKHLVAYATNVLTRC
jgi:high frequency lysogenization protein